ncbi:MAG: DUF2007 domain-containing protein [Chlorobi bacterium]|nr:DUF2007 domain-containing protein [Chlorobiota bacterium]
MKNWVKIQSFDRYHQAELRKTILQSNGIPAVILDEKDSLFLFGNIDLYVEEFNEKKARALIDEFEGLTKINSYIDLKPVLLFQKILSEAGINAILKRKESSKYILDNYELYVENKDVEKTIPYLTGKKLNGWRKLLISSKVRQTKYFVDLLSENLINSIVIKKKDSDYHLEALYVYVKDEDYARAERIIKELKGYEVVAESDNLTDIEKLEEILFSHRIKAIIKKESGKIKLFVEQADFKEASGIIENEKEWTLFKTYSDITNAMFEKSILEAAEIPSVIINDKDTTFLLGDIELFVEKNMLEKAEEIIKNI